MEMKFEKTSFGKRLKGMLKVDFRRMFTMPLLYILVGSCLVMPVLILVMTTMMEGSVSVNPQTGEETVMEGFDNAWQIIGTVSGGAVGAVAEEAGESGMQMSAGASIDMLSMCNINMLFFLMAVLVGLFVSADFRSGYAKNLFAVRAKKGDYIFSKTLVCLVGGILMLLAFFVGTLLGGAIAGLPFTLEGATVTNVVLCMLAKFALVAVFVPIYLAVSVAAKQKAWLSIVGSMMIGMLLFMMIPSLSPLNSTIMNVVLCVAGGVLFSIGLGAVSNQILKKTNIV